MLDACSIHPVTRSSMVFLDQTKIGVSIGGDQWGCLWMGGGNVPSINFITCVKNGLPYIFQPWTCQVEYHRSCLIALDNPFYLKSGAWQLVFFGQTDEFSVGGFIKAGQGGQCMNEA